ncbi:MAG: co-chaperone GroES [Chloroflexi bacterium]|nr:co-chaperone GroES [Chloroflexota bacterium]MBP8058000.1 co-chaperone GroES [Chloroflexota bacterium]
MTIEPLGTRVLIKPLEQESTTPSGLILPETAKEKPQQGMVEAVGNSEQMTSGLTVGDRVLFPKYTGNEVQLNGKVYLVMEENEILARIRL